MDVDRAHGQEDRAVLGEPEDVLGQQLLDTRGARDALVRLPKAVKDVREEVGSDANSVVNYLNTGEARIGGLRIEARRGTVC